MGAKNSPVGWNGLSSCSVQIKIYNGSFRNLTNTGNKKLHVPVPFTEQDAK